MFMFLPFLIALCAAISTVTGKNKITYILWLCLLAVTLLSFQHHATDALALSF
ncbi:MAG: DUF5993 family protein [Pantoea sp.]|uniref:DUF5993 family protein n=1 Tax=Pantoea sp. TaxID=69393 RepID=UPI0039E6DE71